MDPLLAVVSGLAISIAGGVVGAVAVVLFTRWSDRQKDLAARRFRIYMALLDWSSTHFWITSHEFRNEEIPRDIRQRLDAGRYKITDELRRADDLEELPDIVRVLFSLTYPTEVARADALRALTARLGKRVNPRFSAAAKAIEADTMALIQHDMATGEDEWMARRQKIEPW